MEPGPAPPGGEAGGEGPSSSSPTPAASAADQPPPSRASSQPLPQPQPEPPYPPAAAATPQQQPQPVAQLSRYESQKRRDWNAFLQYLRNHKPPLTLARCSGAHVIEFLKYLDQFGKTKVHAAGCPYFGHPNPPAPCACPLRQAWGSLDALIGRLRAAYEENGGRPESNPFGAKAVRIYLREVRESQAKARGIPYEKKKRKRVTTAASSAVTVAVAGEGSSAAAEGDTSATVGGSASANVGSGSSSAAAASAAGTSSAAAGEEPGGAPPAAAAGSGSSSSGS